MPQTSRFLPPPFLPFCQAPAVRCFADSILTSVQRQLFLPLTLKKFGLILDTAGICSWKVAAIDKIAFAGLRNFLAQPACLSQRKD